MSTANLTATCVVGLQWGDEAKGKIVDLLGDDFDFVVRYNGGANAGHTIVHGDKTFKLSLLPTGILKPNLTSVIGNGLVIYPPKFLEEVQQLEQAGIPVGKNLAVSDHAHVIFPYHMAEEKLSETGGNGSIGTTGRGIGPCYQDKVGRRYGIRLGELLHPEHLEERLNFVVPFKNRMLSSLGFTDQQLDARQILEEYLGYADQMRPYITDTTRLLHDGIKAGKKVLFEAAQGSLLDIDHGTYPYVTSSNSLPAGIWSGSGVPSRNIGRIIGVVKAYTTRVGHGPFPTELNDDTAERIRKIGREYGTVTGRPRRVGWFDSVAVRYTSELAGADELSLMLLDVLSGHKELKIAKAYHLNGSSTDYFPSESFFLGRCEPVYETLPGWEEDISGCRKLAELPKAARAYIDTVQRLVGLPVSLVSVGPDRDQTIRVN